MKKFIDSLTQNFDDCKEDRKRKYEIIKSLYEEVISLHTKLEIVQIMIDKEEGYSQRNCLLIHGLEEKENESTDNLVLETINNEL